MIYLCAFAALVSKANEREIIVLIPAKGQAATSNSSAAYLDRTPAPSRLVLRFKLRMHPEVLASFVLDADQATKTVLRILRFQQGISPAPLGADYYTRARKQPLSITRMKGREARAKKPSTSAHRNFSLVVCCSRRFSDVKPPRLFDCGGVPKKAVCKAIHVPSRSATFESFPFVLDALLPPVLVQMKLCSFNVALRPI